MDIERIREFIILAKTCNYQVASDALFTTSSTLSKHIAQMENELSVQLFDRTTRKVTLTNAGKIFLDSANQIVFGYDQAISALKSISRDQGSTMTISFIEVMRQYNVFQMIHDFSALHPDYDIRLMEADAQNMNALLHLNSCDFAFASRLEFFGKDVEALPFAHDELVVILPRNHPLAARKVLTLEDLRNEKFVIHRSYYEDDVFRSHCKERGFDIQPMLTSSNSSTVIDVVSNSMAVAVLSRARCLTHAHITRVVTASLAPRIEFDVFRLYLKNRTLSAPMEAFIRHIKKRAASPAYWS